MSYSPVRRSNDDDDHLDQLSLDPPKLQLRNFDFTGPSFSLDIGFSGRERSGSKASKVKSSVHSGTSYEMVDSESDYDESSGGEGEGRGGNDSGDRRRRDRDREDEIASSGVLVSKFPSSAPSMQGGAFNANGNRQHLQQQHEHDRSAARRDSEIADRLGLQLDGRADNNEREQRGGVSAHASAELRHGYQQAGNHNNEDHPRSPGGSGGSRPHPLLPPPPPQHSEYLDRTDPEYQFSSSPEELHPVFRHSQSVPELPPVDLGNLSIQDDRDYRPATSASGVGDLFKDFDGVHFDTENPEVPGYPLRNYPPPPAAHRQSQAYPRPQSSGSAGLVYYPAPVPAMLNLPPTLSKARPNNRNSRHLAADSIDSPANNRHSVAYPGPSSPGLQSDKGLHRRSVATLSGDQKVNNRRSLANLPPALRASQYFDSQLPPIIADLKEESAVATLDSILDASTRAPAAAFTDHPSAAYNARPRSTATTLGNYRNSVAFNVTRHPGESPEPSINGDTPHPDYHHYNHNGDVTPDDESSHINPETGEYYDNGSRPPSTELIPGAPPTTLLAELESRKAQLRLRSRTAASAFPRGIRSTLLQLDAVAQVQQAHRRQKKTHLAWEEPDDGPDEEERDDDVPLGLLFAAPANQKRRDDEVPLGLLMKKEMEDAEPLSKRRERLRQQGGVAPAQSHPQKRMLDVPGIGGEEGEEEVEGETLRQRMKRLKEKQQFGSGTLDIDIASEKEKTEAKQEVEETLAQRRRRLQEEAAAKRDGAMLQQEVKNRRNMADILHVRPMGMAARPSSFYLQGGQGNGGYGGGNASYGQLQGYGGNGSYGQLQGMNMYGGPGLIGRGAGAMGAMGMGGGMSGGMGGGMGMGMGGDLPLDPKQREVVERWRASVM